MTQGIVLKKRFGKYLLLDHIVDGGMAAIYRAREIADNATKLLAGKVVAIKVIKGEHSQDSNFKDMFLDEIKVAFALIHPNIAQTYNYGEVDKQLFAVLEYIDGKNLKQYVDELKQKGVNFPIDMAVYIITQVCQGLDYAHKFTDKLSGTAANIVHRDISPHNIMLDYDGIVKVIDFGIAKATTSAEHTKTGTIKGKVAYIAPEYLAEDAKLDHRYDQFAVGLTLWELIFGKRLFTGANDMAILRGIYECKIPPPTSQDPSFPKELERIILKSLSRNRDKRYENMDAFNRDLTKFLHTHYPDFHAGDLANFLHQQFSDEITANRNKLLEFGNIDVTPYHEELKKEVALGLTKHIDATTLDAHNLTGTGGVKRSENTTSIKRKNLLRSKKHQEIQAQKNKQEDAIRRAAKSLVFGQMSITDDKDRTISDFIQQQRDAKAKGIALRPINAHASDRKMNSKEREQNIENDSDGNNKGDGDNHNDRDHNSNNGRSEAQAKVLAFKKNETVSIVQKKEKKENKAKFESKKSETQALTITKRGKKEDGDEEQMGDGDGKLQIPQSIIFIAIALVMAGIVLAYLN